MFDAFVIALAACVIVAMLFVRDAIVALNKDLRVMLAQQNDIKAMLDAIERDKANG